MADLDFFFDPMCPWAWITSRWVVEVQSQRDYDVRWLPISLKMLNENQTGEWYTDDYKRGHMAGLEALRVASAVDAAEGNAAVGRLYTELGLMAHTKHRRDDLRDHTVEFISEALASAGLNPSFSARARDESLDDGIRASTELALSRTGRDVGTPIITFNPDSDQPSSFFGPVIARIPRGDDALRLWDAVKTIATTSGLAELKRSLREMPVFD